MHCVGLLAGPLTVRHALVEQASLSGGAVAAIVLVTLALATLVAFLVWRNRRV